MKKAFIYSVFLTALAIIPATASAQTASIFNFKANNKAAVPAPVLQAETTTQTPPAATTTDTTLTTDDELTFTDLQNQPLPVRRKLVAARLNDILIKLDLLSDKTKVASDRLAQNGITTDAAQTILAQETLTIAQAKLSIDALVLAANDPANETAINLMVNGATFKDTVIKTEDLLRTARQSIIDALSALKLAVSMSATVTAE